jgi:hypothetical protein
MDMLGRLRIVVSVATTLSTCLVPSFAHAQNASWLDRPLAAWNVRAAAMPKLERADELRDATVKRCDLKMLGSTHAERAVAAAGWIPFLNFDQQLIRGDVEVVGGMSDADGMCRPIAYNIFVFVAGRFAGSLSPAVMTSRLDASSGAVRIVSDNAITVDFSRYTSTDPLCCPSSHVVVRYAIDRSGNAPVVVPIERAVRP